jgi:O-antigen ligase
VDARRPRNLELGLFLLLVVLPLAFTPFTMGPFGDPKLIVLPVACLLLWFGGGRRDRALSWIATGWVAITIIAAVVSVDPAAGVVVTPTGDGGGVLLVVCCAVVLVCGTGLSRDLVARGSGWLTWTGVVVSVLLLAYRLVPDVVTSIVPRPSLIGATLGNQLFAAAFLAAAMAAAATGTGPLWRRLALLAVMTAAVTSIGERSSLVLPAIALAVAWWRARAGWRPTVAGAVVVISIAVIWQVADPMLPGNPPPESAIHQIGSGTTDPGRLVVWRVSARAWLDRPALGWGPGTTKAAYLHEASAAEVDRAGRGWGDAHDIVLESAVSTGVLGAGAVLVLLVIAAARAVRSPSEYAWVVGAAASLGAYALVEPLNLVLTPLLFLFAGVAASHAVPHPAVERSGRGWPRAIRGTVPVLIGLTAVLSTLAFAASTLERHGYDYGDIGALRASLRLEPWRLSAREELAIQLAVEGRSGITGATEEATETIAAGVDSRPWDPDVRIVASRVATLANDPAAATTWLRGQLQRFPGDRSWVSHSVNSPVSRDP